MVRTSTQRSAEMTRRVFAGGVGGLLAAVGSNARADDPTSADIANLASQPSLKAIGEKSGILFGLCEPGTRLNQERIYFDQLARECSLISPGNEFNWVAVQSDPTEPRYTSLDALAAFCRQNRLGLLGHNLIWYYTIPAWAKAAGPDDFVEAFNSYATTTIERFADVVRRWDVVNEAVDPHSSRADGLRNSAFLAKGGPEYVADAFTIARRAAPRGLLCLNEYGVEYDEAAQVRKRSFFLALIRSLRDANAPVDVIGLQSHLDGSKRLDLDGIALLVRQIKALGFSVAVTELDVNDQKLPSDPSERDRLCAEHVNSYLGCVFSEARPISITTWGFTDSHSWLDNLFKRSDGRPLRPLAFDDQFGRKPLWGVLRKYLSHV